MADEPAFEDVGPRLAFLRQRHGLTQKALAEAAGLHQSTIARIEGGQYQVSLCQLAQLAQILGSSWQFFMTGSHQPGIGMRDIALELRALGVLDLHVEGARIPGAFRPAEQILALALRGNAPEARVVEAIPVVLARNQNWNVPLFHAFAAMVDKRVPHRVAWLADITLLLDRGKSFPGEFAVAEESLNEFLVASRPSEPDSLGRSSEGVVLPPVSRRWNITYPADLNMFRERAMSLAPLMRDRRED